MGGADVLGGSNETDLLLSGYQAPGGDTLLGLESDDVLIGGPGASTLNGGGGRDLILGGPDPDSIVGGLGADEIEAREGADVVVGGAGADELLGGLGDDVLDGGLDDDRIDGGLGDDVLTGGGGDDLLVPGPGRDVVTAGPGDDVVVLYSACEIASGEILNGGPGDDTLVTPLSLAELAAAGVVVTGFEQVRVTTELEYLSDCHCFHGDVVSVSDDELTCACNPGWGGGRCATCTNRAICAEPAKIQQLIDLLVAAQTPETQALYGVRLASGMIAHSTVNADLVVVARPIEILEYQQALSRPDAPETSTRVTLAILEVLKGPHLSTVSFSFNGAASPFDPGFASESPHVKISGTRVFAIRLRAQGDNFLAGEGSDFQVKPDNTIELGVY